MKKWVAIVAVMFFAIFAIADFIHDFSTNDPIGYFTAKPMRIILVGVIALVGGLTTAGFYGLSPCRQRMAKLLIFGTVAIFSTGAFGYSIFYFLKYKSFFSESGSGESMLFMLSVGVGGTAYFWYEFYRTLKRRVAG